MSKRLIKSLRLIFTLLVVALLFYLEEKPISSSDEPVELYSSACQDDLRKVYLDAINGAEESIYLIMYSLSDDRVIKALNKKAREGIKVVVTHDPTTYQKGYERLKAIKRIPIAISGLMHQKILIVDGKRVWIGSANFTTESLRLHDNLVAGLNSPELAQLILSESFGHTFIIGDQRLEFWSLPRDKKNAFSRLIELIDKAEDSIRVAMYTWTHPELTDAVIRAHKRGVLVEVILDRGQANGVGRITTKRLVEAGLCVWLSSGQKLLHHKCLWVDEKILVNGSANWTKAAFSKNKDCFFILNDLTEDQQNKLRTMWFRTRALSNKEHLLVFGNGPILIRNDEFKLIDMAA
ncbi:MAG: phosphatidylserine/phosphatidylglycerophosphate/cardiolipin synthase family protein [Chlamydiales bacterium]|nr:phosphatidylserine/phosphatidylglycerophosphate/cardiolipin synthase family protein [Chlamydiales bacterium]